MGYKINYKKFNREVRALSLSLPTFCTVQKSFAKFEEHSISSSFFLGKDHTRVIRHPLQTRWGIAVNDKKEKFAKSFFNT